MKPDVEKHVWIYATKKGMRCHEFKDIREVIKIKSFKNMHINRWKIGNRHTYYCYHDASISREDMIEAIEAYHKSIPDEALS